MDKDCILAHEATRPVWTSVSKSLGESDKMGPNAGGFLYTVDCEDSTHLGSGREARRKDLIELHIEMDYMRLFFWIRTPDSAEDDKIKSTELFQSGTTALQSIRTVAQRRAVRLTGWREKVMTHIGSVIASQVFKCRWLT